MPNLKDKSSQNMDAAELLISNRKCSPSIHCSYYACIQFSKHILNHFCSIDYEKQSIETKGKDSHSYVINHTGESVRLKNEKDCSNYFINMEKLRMLRNKSDYTISVIGEREARKAQLASIEILDILKKNYDHEN